MARSKQVTINDKVVIVQEKRVSELIGIYTQLKDDINLAFKSFTGANQVSDLAGVVQMLGDKITILFPMISKDDVLDAYPSELEELVGAFFDVNFTGAKIVIMKFGGPILKLIMEGLQKKS